MPVQRFRTKVVEIEAVRFTGTKESYDELYGWTNMQFRFTIHATSDVVPQMPRDESFERSGLNFQVYDDLHYTWINVFPGQWIVRGAKGEFYPCDDETFHWKYEEIKDPDFTMSGTLEYRDGEVTAEGFEFKAGTHNVDDEPVRYEG